MNKRKLLTLAMTLCMVAILAIGGTLAYFTDTDKESNVFTVGGVSIHIDEKKYDNGAWSELTPGTDGITDMGKLEPGVTESFNKVIFTVNDEDTAYIRNYVAIEDANTGKSTTHTGYNTADGSSAGMTTHGVVAQKLDNVDINGRTFDIYVYTALNDAPIAKGEALASLHSFWLDESFTNTDADAYKTIEVYTFSEAIQAAGLTHEEAMAELQGEDASLTVHASNLFKAIVPTTNK